MIGLKAGTVVSLVVARTIKGEEWNGEEKMKRGGGVILKTGLRVEEAAMSSFL